MGGFQIQKEAFKKWILGKSFELNYRVDSADKKYNMVNIIIKIIMYNNNKLISTQSTTTEPIIRQ